MRLIRFFIIVLIGCVVAGRAETSLQEHPAMQLDSLGIALDTIDDPGVVDSLDLRHVQPGEPSISPAFSHERDQRRNLIVVRETDDSVFVIDKTTIVNAVQNWRKNFDVLRQRSIGLSGCSWYGAHAVSIAPVKELLQSDYYLSKRKFHFNHFEYEAFPMSGGSGCIGLGQGFRLGGGGMVGERNFSSDPFEGDSIIVVGVQVSYGGFIVEKAIVRERWNFTAGSTLGGGTLKVVASEKNRSSWFTLADESYEVSSFDESFENGNSAQAGFILFNPHCGFSYTLFPFFHIGMNVSLPMFLSIEKFNIYTNDFFSINPGLYLKLVFGNIG